MVSFYNTTNYLVTQMNNETSFKQQNKERFIIVGVIVIVAGIGHGNSRLDETDCTSYSTNTLGKGMNPIILPPAMGK